MVSWTLAGLKPGSWLGYFPGAGGSVLHGVGCHLEPSDSSLKCVLVTNGWVRYFGSSTVVRRSRKTAPSGSGPSRSMYSVMTAFSLYGTPFFRRYASRTLVVVILS